MSPSQPSGTISSEFPFRSQYVDVLGSRMHYIEEGEGDPILFLHGNPTSSYLWRNVIPHLVPHGRCIAVDLIGMGKSDQPDLEYRFQDHVQYIDAFIEALGLENVTLVLHDWGTGIGFHYAHRHESNVRGIAFMEGMVRPLEWSDFPGEAKVFFRLMRTPVVGWLMLSVLNMFVHKVLPMSVVRKLNREEKARYKEPFRSITSRRPVRRWPMEIPIAGTPADNFQVMAAYSKWLTQTELPKLLFHASPGALIREPQVSWMRENFANLSVVDIGEGIHYLQEDNPHLIGQRIADWLVSMESERTRDAAAATSVG